MKKKIIIACLILLSLLLVGCESTDSIDDGTIQFDAYQIAADNGYEGTYEE